MFKCDLVLPLELCPHAPELGLGAGGGDDIVHNVDVNVVQHHHVPVPGSSLHRGLIKDLIDSPPTSLSPH